MDLIDRSKLPKWDGMALDALRVVNAVMNAPRVDAVELKHGVWESFVDSSGEECCRCSQCGDTWANSYMTDNYCSNCGSRMDGSLGRIKSGKGLGDIKIHENESGITYE